MPLAPAHPSDLAGYLETMSRAVFSSGMSHKVIDAKWSGFVEAFEGFDPQRVAAFTPEDVERLAHDTRIVRNRKKIEATVHNAGELLVAEREFGSVSAYLESFPDSEAVVADLHRRFKFLGESVARMFLYGVAFDVAAQEAWAHARWGDRIHEFE